MTVTNYLLVYPFYLFNIFFNVLFIFERASRGGAEGERETQRERERERERERIPNRLCAVSTEPDMGLALMNCEIVT